MAKNAPHIIVSARVDVIPEAVALSVKTRFVEFLRRASRNIRVLFDDERGGSVEGAIVSRGQRVIGAGQPVHRTAEVNHPAVWTRHFPDGGGWRAGRSGEDGEENSELEKEKARGHAPRSSRLKRLPQALRLLLVFWRDCDTTET